ncbi:MAG TPA: hypothetical protein VGH15_13125 [Caulobacteraceae bacterium]|jgi:predicted protein tyrosine phosphatase
MSAVPPASFQLTICGLEELGLHRRAGVTHVVSILDPGWPEPDEIERWEGCERLLMRFHDVIEADAEDWVEAPATDHVAELLEFGRGLPTDRPVHLLVHCHAGVSRSTASALVLMAQREPSRDPGDIIGEITRCRPQAWPNLRIVEIGDALLGRNGALIEAAFAHYREAAAVRPDLAQAMRAGGRARELGG